MNPEVKRQLDLIKRGTVDIISEEELIKKIERSLKEKKPLKIKAGFDPSAPDIHLGHTVLLRKLRHFQELGHDILFLIGDFTGRIGDPSGKNELRKRLSEEEVLENAKTYKKQVFKILDHEKTKVVFNSHWLGKMPIVDFMELASHGTVAQMLARADFKQRYEQGKDISILEFLYPLLQGYDSVYLKADVEIGGTDQTFNLLMGRELQRDYSQEPQVILIMPLLEGTDGVQKMSKSLGNYIGISEAPKDMFGKTMSISDNMILRYYELLTDVSLDRIQDIRKGMESSNLNPRDAKAELGETLVSLYHSKEDGKNAREEFDRVFKKKEIPEDIKEYKLDPRQLKEGKIWIVQLLTLSGLCDTSSQARRLLEQGGVKIDGKKLSDVNAQVAPKAGMVIQAGKRGFIKII